MKFTTLIIAACTAFLISCSSASEMTEEAIGEKIASKLLGADVDIENYSEEDQAANIASVNLSVDGERLFSNVSDYKSTINASPDMLAMQLGSETDGSSFMIGVQGIQGKNLYDEKPIVGYAEDGRVAKDKTAGTLMMTRRISDSKTTMYILKEGSIKIGRFSKEKIVLEINGTLTEMSNMAGESVDKPISGEIILEHPIISGMGVKVNDIIY